MGVHVKLGSSFGRFHALFISLSEANSSTNFYKNFIVFLSHYAIFPFADLHNISMGPGRGVKPEPGPSLGINQEFLKNFTE